MLAVSYFSEVEEVRIRNLGWWFRIVRELNHRLWRERKNKVGSDNNPSGWNGVLSDRSQLEIRHRKVGYSMWCCTLPTFYIIYQKFTTLRVLDLCLLLCNKIKNIVGEKNHKCVLVSWCLDLCEDLTSQNQNKPPEVLWQKKNISFKTCKMFYTA